MSRANARETADLHTSFEEVQEQTLKNFPELRLVSRQFETLVSPLVFRNITLNRTLALAFCGVDIPSHESSALYRTMMYTRRYARNVTLKCHQAGSVAAALAIGKMESFEVLRYRTPQFQNGAFDYQTIEELCNIVQEFAVYVDEAGIQVALQYEARPKKTKALLRSVQIDADTKVILPRYGLKLVNWDTLESLSTNGYLDLYTHVSHSLKFLRMNREISGEQTLGAATARHITKLGNWFPNLEELELNFEDGEGRGGSTFTTPPEESLYFVASLTNLKKLRELVLWSIPPFIERPLVEGEPFPLLNYWIRNYRATIGGANRVASYKARATSAAWNIFCHLASHKKGVPFERLMFKVQGRALEEAEHDAKKDDPSSVLYAGKCVPSLAIGWQGSLEKLQKPDQLEVWSDPAFHCELCEVQTPLGDI